MLFRSPKPQTPNPKPQTPNPFVLSYFELNSTVRFIANHQSSKVMLDELNRQSHLTYLRVWNSHNRRRFFLVQHGNFFQIRLPFFSCLLVFLVLSTQNQVTCCPIVGCVSSKCTNSGGNSVCLECSYGYYKPMTSSECNLCASQCTSCTAWTTCQSCQEGYFIDQGTSSCIACTSNCESCTSRKTCSRCSNKFSFSNDTLTCVENQDGKSGGDQNNDSSSSNIGPIIGYVVSGLVLVICCALTIIHQRRKQNEEAKEKQALKEQQEKNGETPTPLMQPHESPSKITITPSRTRIVLPKSSRDELMLKSGDHLDEGMRESAQRIVENPQKFQIKPSPGLLGSPDRTRQVMPLGQRPSGAEHIGLLSTPNPGPFLKLQSPMISATSGTPKSAFGAGSSSRPQSTKETPGIKIRPSGFAALTKELARKGDSSTAINTGGISPNKQKIVSPQLALSPEKRADSAGIANLSRIKRIEQRVS